MDIVEIQETQTLWHEHTPANEFAIYDYGVNNQVCHILFNGLRPGRFLNIFGKGNEYFKFFNHTGYGYAYYNTSVISPCR